MQPDYLRHTYLHTCMFLHKPNDVKDAKLRRQKHIYTYNEVISYQGGGQ